MPPGAQARSPSVNDQLWSQEATVQTRPTHPAVWPGREVSFQHRAQTFSLISETGMHSHQMPLKDTQTFSSVSMRKFKLKEAPGPGVQSYPTAEAYLKFANIHPVTKVLYHLFSAHRVVLCSLHQNVIPFYLSPPLPGFCSDQPT